MNAIDATFERLRSHGRKAFIPFLTAGDPDLETTTKAALELAARGADVLEIGFPYSDPIADGPVIQASYSRALDRGVRLDAIFAWARALTDSSAWKARPLPLVGMVSHSLIHRRGPERFLTAARSAGFSGLIIPDLPVEESAGVAQLAAAQDLRVVMLVTPTTPAERARQIVRQSTGFLYCVSLTGITGERDRLPEQLLGQLRWLRQETDLPLCVGFGVSKPEQVAMLRADVDGVIVGSALVRCLDSARPVGEAVRALGDLAESLARALNPDSAS